jgi:hypothetical protein
MGVLLQGFYKKKPNNAVPSPADGNPLQRGGGIIWPGRQRVSQSRFYRGMAPVLKTGSGASPGADG